MTELDLNREWDPDTPLTVQMGALRMAVHSIGEDGMLIKHDIVYVWPNTKKVVVCPPEGVEVEVRECSTL